MTLLTDAFVLRKSQRSDFDRQYTLFTRELGKVPVLAKGAMKISSKLAPHLEMNCLSEVMLAPGRAFYRLAGANLKRRFWDPSDMLKLSAACYFLETADMLVLANNPDSGLFSCLEDFYDSLGTASGRESQIVLNRSLFDLLSHLGYQPRIKAKSQGQLTCDLQRLIAEIGEKEIRSYSCLSRELECAA